LEASLKRSASALPT